MLQKILSIKSFRIITRNLAPAFLLLVPAVVSAQELNCTVRVMAPQIQGDKKVFETLQGAIYEFMNQRKWTDDQFEMHERIELSMQITINKRISNDEFEGTLQIQSSRPVYKTSYNSVVLNHLDEHFNFKYLEFETLEYNENTFTSNLTAMLAYYAYLVIGMDYNTFGLNSGIPYILKAQDIVNKAQNASDKGWRAFESTRNRYWITENILNPVFKPLNETMYTYHRHGLDVMSDEKDEARLVITKSLEDLRRVYRDKPGSLLLTIFFNSKADEIVNIYSKAYPDEKAKVSNLLNEIDPAHSNKYQAIMAN
jgi:hypothetical protein